MRKMLSVCIVLGMTALAGCGSVPNTKPADVSSKPNATASSTDSKEANEISIVASPGVIERFIRDDVPKKYKEKTGKDIKINYTSGLSGENLSKIELQKDAPKVDIGILAQIEVARASTKGLTETLDQSTIPNLSKVDERYVAIDKVDVPIFGYIFGLAYNTKVFEEKKYPPIESWNDILRPEFKGRTVIFDISSDWGFGTLHNLALANGGSYDKLDPGLMKAKEAAANSVTFYKTTTAATAAVQQGQGDVGLMGSYIVADLVNSGIPMKMVVPKEGAQMSAWNAILVKNAPHKKEAEEFLNFLLSEDIQKMSADIGFNPVLKGMKVSPKYEQSIGIKDSDKLYKSDVVKLSEVRSQWSDRWNKEVTPELGKSVK